MRRQGVSPVRPLRVGDVLQDTGLSDIQSGGWAIIGGIGYLNDIPVNVAVKKTSIVEICSVNDNIYCVDVTPTEDGYVVTNIYFAEDDVFIDDDAVETLAEEMGISGDWTEINEMPYNVDMYHEM